MYAMTVLYNDTVTTNSEDKRRLLYIDMYMYVYMYDVSPTTHTLGGTDPKA